MTEILCSTLERKSTTARIYWAQCLKGERLESLELAGWCICLLFLIDAPNSAGGHKNLPASKQLSYPRQLCHGILAIRFHKTDGFFDCWYTGRSEGMPNNVIQ